MGIFVHRSKNCPALVILDSVVTIPLGTDSYNLRSAMLKVLWKNSLLPKAKGEQVSKQGLEGQTRAQRQGDLEKKKLLIKLFVK